MRAGRKGPTTILGLADCSIDPTEKVGETLDAEI
jgi:hypothetical protein